MALKAFFESFNMVCHTLKNSYCIERYWEKKPKKIWLGTPLNPPWGPNPAALTRQTFISFDCGSVATFPVNFSLLPFRPLCGGWESGTPINPPWPVLKNLFKIKLTNFPSITHDEFLRNTPNICLKHPRNISDLVFLT